MRSTSDLEEAIVLLKLGRVVDLTPYGPLQKIIKYIGCMKIKVSKNTRSNGVNMYAWVISDDIEFTYRHLTYKRGSILCISE